MQNKNRTKFLELTDRLGAIPLLERKGFEEAISGIGDTVMSTTHRRLGVHAVSRSIERLALALAYHGKNPDLSADALRSSIKFSTFARRTTK